MPKINRAKRLIKGFQELIIPQNVETITQNVEIYTQIILKKNGLILD
jgi:hypothetical protein